MTEDRLSDRLLAEPMVCYVLLREPLKATFDELLDAADEDYPGPNWGYHADGDVPIDTRKLTQAVDTTGTVDISCTPGRLQMDWTEVVQNSLLFFPRAEQAIADHTDHLRIAINSRNTSLVERLRAARQMTCLATVLAKLPIATAVYMPSANKLIRPQMWAEAAEPEHPDDIPLLQWIAVGVRDDVTDEGAPLSVSAWSTGLAPFLGREFVLPRIQCPGPEAEVVLAGLISMAFEDMALFEDGAEMGFGAFDKSLRVRHCPEGVQQAHTDQIWFLHKTCDIDDRALLGETAAEEEAAKSRTRSDKFRSEIAKRVAARV